MPASSYMGALRSMRHDEDRNCRSPVSPILGRVAAFLGLDASRKYELRRCRDALDMWLTAHNVAMSVALLCNNNIQYVVNACVAFYTACYSSKSQSDNSKLLAQCIGAVTRKLRQMEEEASDGAVHAQAASTFKRGVADAGRSAEKVWPCLLRMLPQTQCFPEHCPVHCAQVSPIVLCNTICYN